MNEPVVDPIVADLARAVTTQLDAVVPRLVGVLVREIENYQGSQIQDDDLHASMRHNVEFILGHLSSGAPVDLAAPISTARRRAGQGVPLPELLRAYRLCFRCVWEELLVEAGRSGPEALTVLLHAAGYVWELADTYSTAATVAYRDAVAERLLETDRRRSALVAALIDGPPLGSETVWEIAQMLGFPFRGTFVVVTAEAVSAGEPPLPGLDAKCQAIQVGSAWRAQPGYELGVLSCPDRDVVGQVLDAVRSSATGRVGVSPVYEALDRTPRALRYAQVALESLPEGTPAVRQLDDTPLTEMVMTNLETTRRAVNRILGGVLSLPEDDRTTLLETARAWMEAHGSAAEAARVLYCHENTVRYRLHRLEEYLRGPLHDPKIVAELAMALDAVGTFPTLLDYQSV